jgi:tetratricopeptide (TPR) repeat protein
MLNIRVALRALLIVSVPVTLGPQYFGLNAQERRAQIREDVRVIETYPFADPNPVPMLASDDRLYPYHRFEGYAHRSEAVEWKVVHLENEWIELWVLPEAGGKVWGARVKETGHEFIYRNEVMKFRNIALRGPWTSGGIEFNFGVIGHTPSTATPVDYHTQEHEDGSVSVVVGAMDLPSRTHWRVEVRLPADRAYFETNVLWWNPTTLEQPYYNWMTAAAFAQDDLVMSIPGNSYLEHPGAQQDWPFDSEGRELSVYDQNRFGSNKSFHVVGELNDFFGGYYLDDDYGFGHWSRYEEMPGQKLWLWALSRQGGIWEDLLTDTDGQYIEFQAGRLLVQYSPGDDVNPISQVGFDPGATDRWTETWFPVEGLGGLSDASRDGAMFVEREGGRLRVRAHAFVETNDTIRVLANGVVLFADEVSLEVLEPIEREFGSVDRTRGFPPIPQDAEVVVEFPRLKLRYHSSPESRQISRAFSTDAEAIPSIPLSDREVMDARELVQGRYFNEARNLFETVLAKEPWNREVLLGLADLEYRRGRYAEGLKFADQVLRLDAYDSEGNFITGNLYRALGQTVDAREAFGWSARSIAFRAVSYVQLAELALVGGEYTEAGRYAQLAKDYDRNSISANRLLAILARLEGDTVEWDRILSSILELDPLHHFVEAEVHLAGISAEQELIKGFRSEYPEQELLELVIDYVKLGRRADAIALLELGETALGHPMLRVWRAYLTEDPGALDDGVNPDFVFPYRPESIPVFQWAVASDHHWSWVYLLGLNLWARDRVPEAVELFIGLGQRPDYGPFYVSRALMVSDFEGGDLIDQINSESDFRRAVEMAPDLRAIHISLIQYLHGEGRWEDALAVSADARRRFPEDFDLDLLHALALNQTERFEASIGLLDEVEVLPSENSSISHQIFAEAHVLAGLDALDRTDPVAALDHLDMAVTWPEHLGLGRPYNPEERIEQYLRGVALRLSGNEPEAVTAFEAVIAETPQGVLDGEIGAERMDLFVIAALDALGRSDQIRIVADGEQSSLAQIITRVRFASTNGADIQQALQDAVRSSLNVFSDLTGRLIYRALSLAH